MPCRMFADAEISHRLNCVRIGVLACLSLLFFSGIASARGLSRSIDTILSPEERICGMLTSREKGVSRTFLLTSDASLRFAVDGPLFVVERFDALTRKYPSGVWICVPADPTTVPSATEPLRVDWFAYIDPSSSGVSVVNQ